MTTKKIPKVAKIIDDGHIVITTGTKDGVKVGDLFKILGLNKTDVTDPDTGKVIGMLEEQKAIAKVQTVYEEMSIIVPDMAMNATYSTPLANPALTAALNISTIGNHFNVDPSEISGGIQISSDTTVKIGDKAIKL